MTEKVHNLTAQFFLGDLTWNRPQVRIYSKIRPEPSGNPSGSGHILPYIPPLVLIRIQYILPDEFPDYIFC